MRALAIFLLFILTACSSLTVQRQETPLPQTSERTSKVYHFFWGFVVSQTTQLNSDICPAGRIEQARIKMNGMDHAISFLTLGLFVPTTITAQCSKTISN